MKNGDQEARFFHHWLSFFRDLFDCLDIQFYGSASEIRHFLTDFLEGTRTRMSIIELRRRIEDQLVNDPEYFDLSNKKLLPLRLAVLSLSVDHLYCDDFNQLMDNVESMGEHLQYGLNALGHSYEEYESLWKYYYSRYFHE